MSRNINLNKQAWDGLNFVLEMFDTPRFPRTVLTPASRGQKLVDSRERAMLYFQGALYEDCYLNAYPSTLSNYDAMTDLGCKTPTSKSAVVAVVPNHIMIDLDRVPFSSDAEFESALADTLNNIKRNVSGIGSAFPIVIASGSGGCHIHVPMTGWKTSSPLEEMPEFAPFREDKDLANKFLRFAERRLSNNKADHCHNPSIKSCLFRVPGTYNTKAKAEVRIVQGLEYVAHKNVDENSLPDIAYEAESASKPTVKFLNDFYAYLVQEKINAEITKGDRRLRSLTAQSANGGNIGPSGSNSIYWIEKLLRIGIDDYRKDLLFWVLAPYLMTVRKMDYDKACIVLELWLSGCNDVRRLEPSLSYFKNRIRYCLDTAREQERLPIKFQTFVEYYPELYKELFIKQ